METQAIQVPRRLLDMLFGNGGIALLEHWCMAFIGEPFESILLSGHMKGARIG